MLNTLQHYREHGKPSLTMMPKWLHRIWSWL